MSALSVGDVSIHPSNGWISAGAVCVATASRTVGNTLTKLTDVNRTNEPTGVGNGYTVRYSVGGRAA